MRLVDTMDQRVVKESGKDILRVLFCNPAYWLWDVPESRDSDSFHDLQCFDVSLVDAHNFLDYVAEDSS